MNRQTASTPPASWRCAELVRSLGAEGRTVFISSHILSEIQHTADQVAIFAKGRLIKAGPVHEVLVAQRGEGVIVKTKNSCRRGSPP